MKTIRQRMRLCIRLDHERLIRLRLILLFMIGGLFFSTPVFATNPSGKVLPGVYEDPSYFVDDEGLMYDDGGTDEYSDPVDGMSTNSVSGGEYRWREYVSVGCSSDTCYSTAFNLVADVHEEIELMHNGCSNEPYANHKKYCFSQAIVDMPEIYFEDLSFWANFVLKICSQQPYPNHKLYCFKNISSQSSAPRRAKLLARSCASYTCYTEGYTTLSSRGR